MSDLLQRWLYDPSVGRLIAAAVGLLVIIAVVKFLSRSAGRYIKDSEARYRLRKFIAFMGYVAAAVLISTVYSNRLSGLTVAFGVAGAGVAFALQEVIASVAGWLALTFSRFYSPGDRVQLGGIKGDVIDVGVLRTTLLEIGDWVKGDLYNGRIVRVANSFVFKEPVFNYSADFPFLWDEIVVPIKFGADRQAVRALLAEATQAVVGDYTDHARASWETMLRTYRLEEARVDPMVTFVATDNWFEYTVRYVVDYRRRRTTKDALFTRILDAIDATNGAIEFASATFELVGAPPIRVRVEQEETPGPR
jgi:small-conductance mechanosensitive channel